VYRFPAHVWNHYDRLNDLPENLLVMGDALCSFNPIYGQGMTVAALEAQVLHRCLAESQNPANEMKNVRDKYFKSTAGIVKAAWGMATGADLAYPQLDAPRPLGSGAVNRYIGNLISLTCYDQDILTVWNQVTNMQRPLSALFSPQILQKVLRRVVTGGPALSAKQPS